MRDLVRFIRDLHAGLDAFVRKEIGYLRDGTRIAIRVCTVVNEIRVRFGNNDLEQAYEINDIEIPLEDFEPIWDLDDRDQRVGAICAALKTTIVAEVKRREEAVAERKVREAQRQKKARRKTYETLKKEFEGEDDGSPE